MSGARGAIPEKFSQAPGYLETTGQPVIRPQGKTFPRNRRGVLASRSSNGISTSTYRGPVSAQPLPHSDREPRAGARVVLIVDDTADTRELYPLSFPSRGLKAATPHDGLTGADAALRATPDVISLDQS